MRVGLWIGRSTQLASGVLPAFYFLTWGRSHSKSSYHPLPGCPTACRVKSKFSAGQHSWLQAAFGLMPLTLYTSPTLRAAELGAFPLWTTFQPSFVLPSQRPKQPSLQGLTCSLHEATFTSVLPHSSHPPILFSRGYDQLAALSDYPPPPSPHLSSALFPFLLRAPSGIVRDLPAEVKASPSPLVSPVSGHSPVWTLCSKQNLLVSVSEALGTAHAAPLIHSLPSPYLPSPLFVCWNPARPFALFRWHFFSMEPFLITLVKLSISYLWAFVTFNFYWHWSQMSLNSPFCICFSSQLNDQFLELLCYFLDFYFTVSHVSVP